MSSQTITTSTGSTVKIEHVHDDLVIVLDHPEAPKGMRNHMAGRIVEGIGFQPAPFAAYALRPEVLRVIADLIEGQGK